MCAIPDTKHIYIRAHILYTCTRMHVEGYVIKLYRTLSPNMHNLYMIYSHLYSDIRAQDTSNAR